MNMIAKTNIYKFTDENKNFKLFSGEVIQNAQVAYQSYGELNQTKDNVVLICHALTGHAHAAGIIAEDEFDSSSNPDLLNVYYQKYKNKPGWWDELIGPDKLFDTNKYFVICTNILGSCYGTTGPNSINPNTNKIYGPDFPNVSVRDSVKLHKQLFDKIGIKKIKIATGGSLGGMQVLEWAIMYPDYIEKIIPIATSAKHSAWAIGLNEVSREAFLTDPEWHNGFYENQPLNGFINARRIAMISYRSYPSFQQKFGREKINEKSKDLTNGSFQVQSYLNYQGKKLAERFDANAYITLSKVMDNHDITEGRGNLQEVLGSIKSDALCIGISTDILYPPEEQKEIASLIPNSNYFEINSIHGHDAFLIEFDQLNSSINKFI